MTKYVTLFKWVVLCGGVITLLNVIGIGIFVLLNEGWNHAAFLRSTLSALMFEGLVMALIGCLYFFGFEKYRNWPSEKVNREKHFDGSEKISPKNGSKLDLGLFFLVLGILLFFIALGFLSLIY